PILLSAPRTIGDFNDDGVVDAADYVVWRNSVGSADLAADANGDQMVDATDYAIWKSNYGRVIPTSGPVRPGQVPEPATLLVVASAAVLAACCRLRGRRSPHVVSSSILH